MAQLLTLRLTRSDPSNSWGFRLQGGKDFGTPLLIQKVNVGSLAEKAGLQVGDAVIRVNGKEVADVRHKDAQDTIVRAGNNVEITVQRGGTSTWKPSVSPVGTVPSPNPYKSASPSPVTKTSLAATNRQSPRIPAGFNSSSKPFSPQQNGGYVNENSPVKAIVNKQYNTPVGIYSDESIAETLSAQAEVLATGVLGVNFKKNEKNYNAESSEVFKMVLEAEKEPKSPEPDATQNGTISPPVSGLRHVSAPQPKSPTSTPTSLTPGQNICADCERLIVGVFVRIKDKNLHVECFKCATCGTSLKNVGYYSINNKLYCDIHAKMIARQNPPAPNLEPLTILPSQTSATKIISSALSNSTTSAPLSPQPTLAPVPFHPPRQSPTHVSSPVPPSQSFPSVNGSKSFTSTNSPKPGYFQSLKSMPFSKGKTTENTAKPFSSPSSDPQHISYYNPSQRRLPFLKPRAEKTSAFMPVMRSINVHSNVSSKETLIQSSEREDHVEHDKNNDIKLETVFESSDQREDDIQTSDIYNRKKLSLCSQEVKRLLESVSQNLPESISNENRPESPVPSESAEEFQHYERSKTEVLANKHLQHCLSSRPHSVRSISPCERPLTPNQIVVFPPEVPSCLHKSNIASPVPTYARDTKSEPENQNAKSSDENETKKNESGDGAYQCTIERTRETLKVTCISPIPIANKDKIEEKNENCDISLRNLPQPTSQPGSIASLLKTAPDRPFTPIEPAKATIFTEPVPLPPETIPYLPTSKEENYRLSNSDRTSSPLVVGLTIASERPFSPLPTTTKFEDLFPAATDEPKLEEKPRPSLAEALTTAPERSYTPLSQCNTEKVSSQEKSSDSGLKIPDLSEDPSVILTRPVFNEMKKMEKPIKKITNPVYVCSSTFHVTEAAFPPICDELKAKFEKRLRTGSITEKPVRKKSTESAKQQEESGEEKCVITSRSPFSPNTGLHKPVNLPHYQQCVKELSSRNKTPSLSRKNTPTPSSRTETSRKNTPTNFEATVCTQQKIFNPELTLEVRNSFLKPSALSFLTEMKEISEKIPPVLGYQPGSIVENLSSYSKVEQCVKTVCEKTLKQIQQSTAVSDHGKITSCESVQHSNATEQHIVKKKISSRSATPTSNTTACQPKQYTSHTNVGQCCSKICTSSRPSTPISASKISSEHANQSTVSQQNRSETTNSSQALSKSVAASQLSHSLFKTLSALTSNSQSSNISSKNTSNTIITSSDPNLTGSTIGGSLKGGTSAGFSAPRRGKGVWNPQNLTPGARIPLCAQCSSQIRGPFITALGKIWCPEHFVCVNRTCQRSLLDIGFVEEPSGLHCEYCFEKYLAPTCGKCSRKIKGDCLNAIGKHFHPECFTCAYCNKLFGNSPFFLEEGLPYCENDWNELFTTKCFACGFPIEAGDRWVEALNNNYHSPCFNCTMCKTNLEGQSFYAKGGRPFCKNHAR